MWLSAEAIELGHHFWILHPISCHTPEVATTVFKCFWGWMQKASETCRVLLQLLILYTIWLSAEAIELGHPFWILHPVSCHTPEAATTVFKCFWGWMQKASETCRVFLQLLINILPSCITLVLYIYIVNTKFNFAAYTPCVRSFYSSSRTYLLLIRQSLILLLTKELWSKYTV